MKEVIVREYLQSLKEDKELDLLFPILLEVMGFQVVTTAKEYKGHKQYGKDIIAYGIDPHDGVKKRFYFELKGAQDRDINSKTYKKDNGIRDSIIDAKDKDFTDKSIEGFDDLPIKYVIAHNGILDPNISDVFKGKIEKEFPKDGDIEFARWGIYKLTHLFSKHLFSEYLLTNEENIRLFKRVLVFMDVPENSQRDFFILVKNIISNTEIKKPSKDIPVHIIRFFETLKLIGLIVHQYSHDADNLDISKRCISYLVLKTWGWILSNKLENNKRVGERFQSIVILHNQVLNEYFEKLLPIVQSQYGLYSENGGRYEQVGYPLRSMEFIKYLYYWFMLTTDKVFPTEKKEEILTRVIVANDGTYRPILDVHSIPVLLTILFYIKNGYIENAKNYLINVFEQVILLKKYSGILPDGKNNPESLIRLTIRREKSVFYEDKTSMLIGMLFELLAILKMEDQYNLYKEEFADIHLATFVPFSDDLLKVHLPECKLSFEELLFSQTLYEEGYQSEIRLDNEFERFVEKTKAKKEHLMSNRTIDAGYAPLLTLAHIFYETPFPPSVWRQLFNPVEEMLSRTEEGQENNEDEEE